MRFRDKRNRVMLCSVLIIMMFMVFSPSVQFQISVVHEGDWETVEYIDNINALNTKKPVRIEGNLISRGFALAAAETNYVDDRESQLYGNTVPIPPAGMGIDDDESSVLQEGAYITTTYTTKTSYTGGSLPSGWTNARWTFGGSRAVIAGYSESNGNFYTNTHDMSSYGAVRVKFDWMNDGNEATEYDELKCVSYEGSLITWFHSPAGKKSSYEDELRDSSWHSTGWYVRWYASGLTGDIESYEGFRVDNIYLQGKVTNTYSKFEAVYRFDSVDYSYGTERLYIDYDASSSEEGLSYYAGTTTEPSSFIGSTSGAEPDTDFDIHAQLTGTPFYVKIRDTVRTDSSNDVWKINRLYLSLSSDAPVNSQTPVCVNMNDTDNLYAGYKTYLFTSNVTDADGYDDIKEIELRSYDYGTTTLRWSVNYTQTTNIFSEDGASDYIELLTGSCLYSKSGNSINITWAIKVEWKSAPYLLYNDDLRQGVDDEYHSIIYNEYDSNYNYIAEVQIKSEALSDGSGTLTRGNYDTVGGITASGEVIYLGSASCYPSTGEIDVWVTCSDTPDPDWHATNYESSGGTFSVAVDSDDEVTGIPTVYTFKVVLQGEGSSGTDFATGVNEVTYIADALTITITGPTDNRQNIDANASGIHMSAVYDYDGETFDGTLTLNNTDYNGDGTVVRWGYTVSSASGDTYGVTAIATNDDTYMIWDRIKILTTTTDNGRIDYNTQAIIAVTAELEYDDHPLGTGDILYMNGTQMTWNGSHFVLNPQFAAIDIWNFFVNSTNANETTYGITLINVDGNDVNQIWDRIQVQSYSRSDDRNNVDADIHIDVTLWYDYDNTLVTDGTVTIFDWSTHWSAAHQGSGVWRISRTRSAPGGKNYKDVACSGNTLGISTVDQNGQTIWAYWDRIEVQTTVVDDGRVDYGANVQIRVTLRSESDLIYLGAGDSVTLNGTAMNWDAGNSWFELNVSFSAVGSWSFFVNSTSEATYQISALNLDGNSVDVIWDRIKITATAATDGRIDYGTTTTLNVTARLEYEGGGTHNLGSGDTLYMNDTSMTWDTDHYYITTGSYSIVDIINYFVNSSSANEATYGITVVNLDSNNADVIWDRIKILTTTATDGRIDYGTNTMINVTAELEYDSHGLGSGDTLYMNGTSMTWDTDHFYLTTGSYSIVDLINYFVNSSNANEVTHGITVINLDGNDVDVIWDRIKILTTVATDGRIDYGTTTILNVTATLEYAAHSLGSGDTLYMNDTQMTWDTDHFYLVTGSYNIVDIIGYYVNSTNANEATYGITVINLDGNDVSVIWDRIKILTTTVTDGRIDYGTTTIVNVTAELEYDSHGLTSGDTLYMNGTSMTWDTDHFYLTTGSYNIVDIINYFVNSSSANEATHGITVINLDSNSVDVIWDRILILTTVVHDARIDYGTQAIISVTARLEYTSGGTHSLGSGDALYMNNTSMSWNGSHFILNPLFSVVGLWNFFVNSSSANESTYGITVVNLDSNDVNTIWDRVIWQMYTRNTTANEGRQTNCSSVNIGETVNITARFLFEHDSTAVTSGTILLEGESMSHIANGYWYLEVSNATASFGGHYRWNSFVTTGNTYDITVENANSKDFYIIWDSIYIDAHGVEPDGRHNMGEYPTLWVTARLTYDASLLDTTSDYIKLAGQTFQWNGSYLVNNTFTLHQVGQFTLGTNDTGHYESTYGITEIEYYSFTTIFDRVFIYAMWSPTETDNRTNYGDTETVYVSFVSEYDNSSMTAGTFELNSTGMSYVSGSIWQKTGYSYSEVVNYTFNVNSASWSAYGINQINYNGWNVTYYHIVWDRVKILTTETDDGRIDFDTNATLSVTAELEYDSHSLGSGDTLYLNNTAMTWNGTHFILLDQKFASIGVWNYYVNTSGVSEATYGITYLYLDGNNVNQIWDRVYLTSIHVSDSRASYGADVNVTVTAKAEHDNGVLGSGDSIYINGTLATWDSIHSVFNVTYSYSEVVNKTFHVTATTEATYGITAFTNDTYVWIIWDRLKITDFGVDNVIPDPLQMIFINLTMVYEFDDAEFHFDNGTITMIAYNVTWDVEEEKNMHWNGTNWQFNHTMPAGVGVVRTFNISAFTDSVYAIVVINWNGFDNVTAGSDRVLVVSYTVSDDRDDINDYIWLNVTLQLESNGTAIVDGDVVVNGYVFTHISGGNWRYNTTQASVTSIDFNSVVAENNTYGIETVNQNGQYTTIIWDRIVITNFWVVDNRTDVNNAVQIRLTAKLDYDNTLLGNGDSIYINGTLATWDSINLRFYISESYGSALNYTYALTSITEIYYTITEVTNTSYVWQIWDQFVLTRFNSSDADGRTNLDETEYIHFGMKWDYDDEVFQSGNGTIYLNSTLMIWNSSQNCWSFSWVNITPVSYLFAYASHTDSVHGITAIDWGAYDNVTQTWDRIGVVVATNMTWTVVGYNVMISYTSTYESDGVTWGGNATVANTSMVATSRPRNENLTFTTVCNKTFYATVISADPNGVTGFTTTTVWCVWDNMTAVAMYGVEIAEGSKTFTISFRELQWQYNSSGVGADWICNHIRNGTVASSATTGEDDLLSPLEQEIPISIDWDAILYSNNATKTIGERSYNFQWYSVTQIIVAIRDIEEEHTQSLDTTIVISGRTNVDFTWTVYNEGVASGESGTVSNADDWRITFNMIMTYGNHSYAIYFDAGASGNRWLNSTYFIDFDVNIDPPEVRGVSVEVRGVINIACSYYVYHEGVYSDETGSLTPTTFSFFFTKKTTAGLHNYSLYFNVSATVGCWKPGSYYVDPTRDYCRITLYNSEGTGLDIDHFIVYVNGTRYYGNEFYGRTDYDYNITVTDYFGYTVYSNTYAYSRNLDIGISFYVYKVKSELQGQAIYFNLTRTGGARFSQHILSDEIVKYYLVAGEYTYEFKKVTTPGGNSFVYYEGTFTLSCDKTHIIDGTNLRDLVNDIELIPTGKADVKPLEASMTGLLDMISMMQLGMWGLAFLIIAGMTVTATDEKTTKDGKVIKKRKVPKQLRRFLFKRGAANPKSKAIPKGAGRASWKGISFRDEVEDWRKKK